MFFWISDFEYKIGIERKKELLYDEKPEDVHQIIKRKRKGISKLNSLVNERVKSEIRKGKFWIEKRIDNSFNSNIHYG